MGSSGLSVGLLGDGCFSCFSSGLSSTGRGSFGWLGEEGSSLLAGTRPGEALLSATLSACQVGDAGASLIWGAGEVGVASCTCWPRGALHSSIFSGL